MNEKLQIGMVSVPGNIFDKIRAKLVQRAGGVILLKADRNYHEEMAQRVNGVASLNADRNYEDYYGEVRIRHMERIEAISEVPWSGNLTMFIIVKLVDFLGAVHYSYRCTLSLLAKLKKEKEGVR